MLQIYMYSLWNVFHFRAMHTHMLIGNFKTQAVSNIISSICAIVLIFSTWQYTLNPPSCCPRDSENTTTLFTDEGGGCEELQRDILLSNLNLHIPPTINITTSIIALVVCEAINLQYRHCTCMCDTVFIDTFSIIVLLLCIVHMHTCTYTAVFNQYWYALDTERVRCRSVWR